MYRTVVLAALFCAACTTTTIILVARESAAAWDAQESSRADLHIDAARHTLHGVASALSGASRVLVQRTGSRTPLTFPEWRYVTADVEAAAKHVSRGVALFYRVPHADRAAWERNFSGRILDVRGAAAPEYPEYWPVVMIRDFAAPELDVEDNPMRFVDFGHMGGDDEGRGAALHRTLRANNLSSTDPLQLSPFAALSLNLYHSLGPFGPEGALGVNIDLNRLTEHMLRVDGIDGGGNDFAQLEVSGEQRSATIRAVLRGKSTTIVREGPGDGHVLRGARVLRLADCDLHLRFYSQRQPQDPALLAIAGIGTLATLAITLCGRRAVLRARRHTRAELRHAQADDERRRAREQHQKTLSYLCHELRNPLAAVIAGVDEVLLEAEREERSGLREVLRRCRDMVNVLNDVRETATMEVLPSHLRRVRISEFMRDVRHQARQQLRPEMLLRTFVRRGNPEVVTLDPRRVRQVLMNAVTNAVRAAIREDGKDVTITIVVDVRGDLYFDVWNQGIGLSGVDVETLFAAPTTTMSTPEPKYKSPASPPTLPAEFPRPGSDESFEGLASAALHDSPRPALSSLAAAADVEKLFTFGVGLGLPLCRRIARSAGGDAGLRDVGPYTHFWLRVPLRTEVAVDGGESDSSATDTDVHLPPAQERALSLSLFANGPFAAPVDDTRRKVWAAGNNPLFLVIDDERVIRRVTEGMLRREGVESSSLEDGVLLDRWVAQQGWPRAILLDIVMPKSDGEHLVREIRRQNKDIPVLAMTGNVEVSAVERYARCGFNGVIGKPISRKRLQRALRFIRDLDRQPNAFITLV